MAWLALYHMQLEDFLLNDISIGHMGLSVMLLGCVPVR